MQPAFAETATESRAASCYHCGLPVSEDRFRTIVSGAPRAMCCEGCRCIAQAIVANGLEDYYRNRSRFPDSPREAVAPVISNLRAMDAEQTQRAFVRALAGHEREASLILEGIHCPACLWLNETHLARQPGVLGARINYTTRRATVRWDARVARLSDLVGAVQAIGYRAYPYDPGAMEASRSRERRDALLRLAIAGLGMMQVMMYAFPAYVAGAGDLSPEVSTLMRWASLLLTLPVVLYSAQPFFAGALRDLRGMRTGMDVPVAIGIGTAFVASVAATLGGRGEVYFDSIAMFVFFLLGARFVELRARHRAAAHLEFRARALPALAQRYCDLLHSPEVETIAAGALRPGDRVLVRTGENFPADGRIERGETEVDEALITGESRALPKRPGDPVMGGSVNRGQPVAQTIERVGADTVLSAIARLMERCTQDRPLIQQVADRIAARFVFVVLTIAIGAALYWTWTDPAMALPVVVAVLVVTCPCALSLATPMAMAVATGAMARRGIVVTQAQAIENLARATHFVFDKTGTLTEGRLELVEIQAPDPAARQRALMLAAALERESEHALGRAIVAAAPAGAPLAFSVKHFPGQGIEGRIAGRLTRIGQQRFVTALCAAQDTGQAAYTGDATIIWLGDESGVLAGFVLEDRLRDGASGLVLALRRAGRFAMLFSGDGAAPVRKAAAAAGILYDRARMLPEEKMAAVRQMQGQGAVVAMIGDGINDAPVLAQAQVSIAMGSGAALAQRAADMVLVSSRLSDLQYGFMLARKTLRIVRQNLAWAFAYNMIALPLAVTGWLTPWMAGIGMSASSLLVVINALRARRTR